jgi:hypothetical protein
MKYALEEPVAVHSSTVRHKLLLPPTHSTVYKVFYTFLYVVSVILVLDFHARVLRISVIPNSLRKLSEVIIGVCNMQICDFCINICKYMAKGRITYVPYVC